MWPVRNLIFAAVVSVACECRATTTPMLTVDLRAVSTTSGTVIDAKHVEFTGGVGGIVTMDVYSVVSGYMNQFPQDDFMDFLHGSFLTSFDGLLGNLSAHLEPNYSDFFASNGLRQDLDGDGDLDVGSNNNASAANFFRAYRGQFAPSIPVDKIATLTWTCAGGGDQMMVNFRPRQATFGAQWVVDGNIYDPSLAPFTVGTSVQILVVPEPESMLALFLGLIVFESTSFRATVVRRRTTGGQQCAESSPLPFLQSSFLRNPA